MKKTENYAMPYPEQDDYFNVEDFQDMMVSVDNLMKKLSDSGAQISSDAEHLYNQTKAQMDNIQKRMNAFTALKEGSTTGDAELKDIRVSYDGKEYGNAGEAVREQASDIHKALFGAGASIWSKAKAESVWYTSEEKGICILNERFTAAGVVTKISRGIFAENESSLNLDKECSAYIVEFEKTPGTVYMPSAETIKIVSTTKITFEANGNARCWIPVEKGQYLAVDSTATAYTCESSHVPYMLYDQANETLEYRGFVSTGSTELADPYSLALEYKLEYDMDDTGLVKQIDVNREATASLQQDIGDISNVSYEYIQDMSEWKQGYVDDNGNLRLDNTYYRYIKRKINTGQAIKISCYSFGGMQALAWYDKNDKIIKLYNEKNTKFENREFNSPEEANYVVVSSYVNTGKMELYVKVYKDIAVNLKNIKNKIGTVYNALEYGMYGNLYSGLYANGTIKVNQNAIDNTEMIQSILNMMYVNGGGILELNPGTYMISDTITIPPFCKIQGKGDAITELAWKPGYVRKDKPMIIIPCSPYAGIKHLRLNGGKEYNEEDISSPYYFGKATGILIKLDEEYKEKLNLKEPYATNESLDICNITITGFWGDGIIAQDAGSWVYNLRDIDIRMCSGYGLIVTNSDNQYSNINIFHCSKGAAKLDGATNNIFVGGKWYLNGQNSEQREYCAALYMRLCGRNHFIAIDMQDNYKNGIVMTACRNNVFSGCVIDGCGLVENGSQSEETIIIGDSAEKVGIGLIEIGSYQNTYVGIISNYSTKYGKQYKGAKIVDCKDSVISANIYEEGFENFIDGDYIDFKNINLEGYVKSNQIATAIIPGLVQVNQANGLKMIGNNLAINGADEDDIKKASTIYRAITPKNLYLAVKVGLTQNTLELSEAEKNAFKKWVGID